MSTPQLQIHTPTIEPLERALNRSMARRLRPSGHRRHGRRLLPTGSSRRLEPRSSGAGGRGRTRGEVPRRAAAWSADLRALGIDVAAASVVGVDRAGAGLRRMLGDRGVCTTTLIAEPGRRSRVEERLVVRGQPSPATIAGRGPPSASTRRTVCSRRFRRSSPSRPCSSATIAKGPFPAARSNG